MDGRHPGRRCAPERELCKRCDGSGVGVDRALASSPPGPAGGRGRLACAGWLTRSSTCSRRAASGGCCRGTSLRAAPSTATSGPGSRPGLGACARRALFNRPSVSTADTARHREEDKVVGPMDAAQPGHRSGSPLARSGRSCSSPASGQVGRRGRTQDGRDHSATSTGCGPALARSEAQSSIPLSSAVKPPLERPAGSKCSPTRRGPCRVDAATK